VERNWRGIGSEGVWTNAVGSGVGSHVMSMIEVQLVSDKVETYLGTW
jgi:hypothetical protein